MTYSALNQYKQNTVYTATPEELTLMLYDGCIKFMNIAKYNIENKNIQKSHEALLRAQDIIMELRSTLDPSYQISNNLMSLYDFMRQRLIDANINKDIKPIEEVLELMTDLRDTWKEAMKQVKKQVYGGRRV
ncbi:MAG: flagellar export chaperone FliS [Tissierellia bacterium]|nr:flagellar export chaperone FliS [Tissierellia bacterium]